MFVAVLPSLTLPHVKHLTGMIMIRLRKPNLQLTATDLQQDLFHQTPCGGNEPQERWEIQSQKLFKANTEYLFWHHVHRALPTKGPGNYTTISPDSVDRPLPARSPGEEIDRTQHRSFQPKFIGLHSSSSSIELATR